ncbi:MAG TPA: MiaB/RimO family radical SAM methylthiotransferase [Candidatus Aminicenantes bacterium]|nr:MiaB/RimO family radical SAM methylthiotransferase [Candidatus Aminicenantes bacterium]
MRFAVRYFGCRSNQAEVQEWAQQLEEAGYQRTEDPDQADFVLLNTCSVTETAEREVLRTIGKAEKAGRPVWLVAGCTVTSARERLVQRFPHLTFFDNEEKEEIVPWVREHFPVRSNLIFPTVFKSRLFLKIQDGCNFRCAYCIVPRLRGRSRSLPIEEVVRKARYYASLGYREVVLTGINLSSFGYDRFPRQNLLELVQELCAIRALAVVRLSSLDPRFLRYHLVRELAALPKVADSFHFSLQTGSDAVLKAMNRGGRVADFRRMLGYFARFFPAANLGADLIVGFPGEGDREHAETVAFVRDSPLTYLHVFPFSPRPGTRAAGLAPLPAEVVKPRLLELREIASERRLSYRERFRGQVLEGIVIEEGEDQATVLTRNYLSVRIPPVHGSRKKRVAVRLTAILNDHECEGQIVRR